MDDTNNEGSVRLIGISGAANDPAPRWSPLPPKAWREQLYRRVRAVRRPSGALALPAITTTATAYFTGVLPHSDSLMAFGLTSLVVFYDAVIAVCRVWEKTRTTGRAVHTHVDGRDMPSVRVG